MRRTFGLGVLVVLALATAAWAGAKTATARIYVNGVPVRGPAIVHGGITYVPVRAVAEALHCEVSWDRQTGVQIWSAMSPVPGELAVPKPPVDPYPRPVMPQPIGPRTPRTGTL